MPAEGGLVAASNHFSEVDPAILGLHCRRQLYYMAKIELLEVPIAGEILRWTGAFAVRRGEGDRDSVRMARWVVSHGHGLGVFAEGTRQQFGYPGPMHPGAAMIAIQEGVPIVPVRDRHVRLEPEEPAAVLRRLGRPDRARPAAERQGLQGGDGDRPGARALALAAGGAGDRRRLPGDPPRRCAAGRGRSPFPSSSPIRSCRSGRTRTGRKARSARSTKADET